MQLSFIVHGVNATFVSRDVQYGNQTVRAEVPATVVELVSEDGSMSQTVQFVAESEEDVRATFVVGQPVYLTYSAQAPE